MIDSIKRMSLDLHSTTSNESVRVKRSDTGRKICISLVDGGLPYTISDGCYAYFTAKKPDGNILKNRCSIENNTVIYRLTEQTTSVVGRVDSEIKLYGADGRCITSSKFTIYVYDTVYSTGDDTQPDKTDPVLQSKTVKPEADPVIVRPDTGYDALFQVVVEGDSDLVPENIKKGVNIFGVGGSYEGSGGITPTGTKTITTNGTHDVTNYAYAQVNVPTDVVYGEDIEVGSLSELHAWSKYTIASGSAVETQLTNQVVATNESVEFRYIDYADAYRIVDGDISLVDPESVDMFGLNNDIIIDKFIYSRYQNAYYRVPSDAQIIPNTGIRKLDKLMLLTYTGATGTTEEFVSIVVSEDITAYPQNGKQDGYKYVYNGTLGDIGDFIVTDDGAGNVTITSSVISDNNGNVVIS